MDRPRKPGKPHQHSLIFGSDLIALGKTKTGSGNPTVQGAPDPEIKKSSASVKPVTSAGASLKSSKGNKDS